MRAEVVKEVVELRGNLVAPSTVLLLEVALELLQLALRVRVLVLKNTEAAVGDLEVLSLALLEKFIELFLCKFLARLGFDACQVSWYNLVDSAVANLGHILPLVGKRLVFLIFFGTECVDVVLLFHRVRKGKIFAVIVVEHWVLCTSQFIQREDHRRAQFGCWLHRRNLHG